MALPWTRPQRRLPRFVITLDSPLAASECWRRVFDLRQHTRIIPLTTVRGDDLDSASIHVGSRFVGRTGLGPLGFDDPMTVDTWSPPNPDHGRCTLTKHGRVIRGRIDVSVDTTSTGSQLQWEQELGLALPLSAGVAKPLVRAGYRWTLRRLLQAEPL